jgi:hypothetical protein
MGDKPAALFIAPVLVDAAFDTSPRDLRANWRPVASPFPLPRQKIPPSAASFSDAMRTKLLRAIGARPSRARGTLASEVETYGFRQQR